MSFDVSAPARAPFLQIPESLIDNPDVSDSALRLLQALAKLPPRNGRNSDAVARTLGMGKDKTNAARKSLRITGHWHARKRQHADTREIRDQRLASLTPLRTPEEIAAGWAAAEEAARLGKDTAESRRLGVRVINSAVWLPRPAAGSPAPRTTRPRPLKGDKREQHQTPLPVPTTAPAEAAPAAPPPAVPATAVVLPPPAAPAAEDAETELPRLTGPLASFTTRAEQVLLTLRRHAPELPLSTAEAHELARIAGHHLLRGETPGTLRATLTHGLPPDGVRCPGGFVRQRLVRYLPPVPDWPSTTPRSTGTALGPTDSAAPPPHRTDGPVARITAGLGWRAAMQAAGPPV